MVSQHKYIFMSLVCFIWEYVRKRIRCPLNEKMENQRIPLLLKLSSESIAEAQRKFLFPSLRLSQTSESFLLSVSWILFVFNKSFYPRCRECLRRSFLVVLNLWELESKAGSLCSVGCVFFVLRLLILSCTDICACLPYTC